MGSLNKAINLTNLYWHNDYFWFPMALNVCKSANLTQTMDLNDFMVYFTVFCCCLSLNIQWQLIPFVDIIEIVYIVHFLITNQQQKVFLCNSVASSIQYIWPVDQFHWRVRLQHFPVKWQKTEWIRCAKRKWNKIQNALRSAENFFWIWWKQQTQSTPKIFRRSIATRPHCVYVR